jgi:trigger factor
MDGEVSDKLMDALLERMQADIPEVMFEMETENELRDLDNNLRMQGLDLSTYCKYCGMDLDMLRAQMRPRAEKQVKVRLTLEKIAALEGLSASAEAIEDEYKRISEAYNVPVDQVKAMIDEKDLAEDLKVKAAMDLVKEKAVVTAA